MTTKRFLDNHGSNWDQPSEKRVKTRLASVIGEVVMVNSLKHFCSALEPMLRRVVHEEVDRGLRRCTRSLSRSSSLRLPALEPSTLELKFNKSLSLPIFTGTKIVDQDSDPLQILLVDTRESTIVLTTLPNPIKIEIVVLDGDFPASDRNDWTSEEFDRNIVREREGKRPLLTGELSLTMRSNGIVSVGELELTDNSSWIRSRRFRLGARVSPGSYQGVRIREAMTEAFVVKDHRGELYKKHHPPSLHDEVWRLEKIGKEGAFHKKLAAANINTVQDFLKLSVVDQSRLRRILGTGMSEKIWEVTIKHARTCQMGSKHYIFTGNSYSIVLNPICQVERAVIDGRVYSTRDTNINRHYIEGLVRQAYSNWNSLEETECVFMNEAPQLTHGDMEDHFPNNNTPCVSDKTFDGEYGNNNSGSGMQQTGASNWLMTSPFVGTPIDQQYAIGYSITEASSDGDLTPRSFLSGS